MTTAKDAVSIKRGASINGYGFSFPHHTIPACAMKHKNIA